MYLLDTNVVSELRKSGTTRLDDNLRRWAESVPPADMYLSVVTLAELEIGVLSLENRDPVQALPLRTWLEQFVKVHFHGRIFDITPRIALAFARLSVPNRVGVMDGLIAATAIEHNMTVVTRNVTDFPSVRTINPFKA